MPRPNNNIIIYNFVKKTPSNCWFCSRECLTFVSICPTCQNDIEQIRLMKKQHKTKYVK